MYNQIVDPRVAPKVNIKRLRPIRIRTVPAVLAELRIKKPIVIISIENDRSKVPYWSIVFLPNLQIERDNQLWASNSL